MWESWSWMLRLKVMRAGAAGRDSCGIERATANRDRWHCKCRLVTGDKPKNWRRTAFSWKTLCSAKGLVAWNFVVCPRESWKLREQKIRIMIIESLENCGDEKD